MDNVTNVKMSRLVRPLLYTSGGQFFQIRSIQPKKAGWCQFDNLTLSPLVFPKMNFLEERQSPAFSDFFKRYDGLLLQL